MPVATLLIWASSAPTIGNSVLPLGDTTVCTVLTFVTFASGGPNKEASCKDELASLGCTAFDSGEDAGFAVLGIAGSACWYATKCAASDDARGSSSWPGTVAGKVA